MHHHVGGLCTAKEFQPLVNGFRVVAALSTLGVEGTFACCEGKQGLGTPLWAEKEGRLGHGLVKRYTPNCTVTDCGIAHTGGSGLWLRHGCGDNRIEGTAVQDIAGNGLMIGDHTWNFLYYRDPSCTVPPEHVPTDNVLANNHIHNCGVVFHGGVWIWLAFTDGTVVRHNLIHHLPYTGISVGWMWREKPNTVCRRNIIEANHVYDVMRLLADGGCIYTLGRQDGTVLRGNLLHDVRYSPVAQQSQRSNNGIFRTRVVGEKCWIVNHFRLAVRTTLCYLKDLMGLNS